MSIWRRVYGETPGGWKTYGPNGITGVGAFASDGDTPASVSAEQAMKIAALFACVNLRSETIGSLPIQVRDKAKNILTDHPLYYLLHHSPNQWMVPAGYTSMNVSHMDLLGNAISIIRRNTIGQPIALLPYDPDVAQYKFNKSGSRRVWNLGEDEFKDDDVLHIPSFTMNGMWGQSRLSAGAAILRAQLDSNTAAQTAFRNGLKVGNYFLDERQVEFTKDQRDDFEKRLRAFRQPENAGMSMTLPKGIKPAEGAIYRISPAEAQLLESRQFGIREICRLFNVPPILIHETDKASSWASSSENINLFFLIYSLLPTLIRVEQFLAKKLLTAEDVGKGIQIKFSLQGLLRGDMKTRQAFYASALQNGWMNRDEVRDLEDRGSIPGGDKYTVQLNMTDVNDLQNTDGTDGGKKPNDDEGEDK